MMALDLRHNDRFHALPNAIFWGAINSEIYAKPETVALRDFRPAYDHTSSRTLPCTRDYKKNCARCNVSDRPQHHRLGARIVNASVIVQRAGFLQHRRSSAIDKLGRPCSWSIPPECVLRNTGSAERRASCRSLIRRETLGIAGIVAHSS